MGIDRAEIVVGVGPAESASAGGDEIPSFAIAIGDGGCFAQPLIKSVEGRFAQFLLKRAEMRERRAEQGFRVGELFQAVLECLFHDRFTRPHEVRIDNPDAQTTAKSGPVAIGIFILFRNAPPT